MEIQPVEIKIKRKNKKHFVVFNNGGVISASTPKDWARAHRSLFKDYDFSDSDNTPKDTKIEKQLIQLGFSKVNNNEVIIFYDYLSL